MKLRIAKKVLCAPDKYSGQQRFTAAHRLLRRASTFKDGSAGYAALYLKPQRSYHTDDQLDLRMECLTADLNAGFEPIWEGGAVVVPTTNIDKPVFRKDGQVHNFAALPFPSKVTYKPRVVTLHDQVSIFNEIDTATFQQHEKTWTMGEWRIPRQDSAKKYQVRTRGVDRGLKPKRLKFSDFTVDGVRKPESYRRPRVARDA